MTMHQLPRFVLVYRKTRLVELVERFNTVQQTRFYLEQSGADFEDYQREDEHYRKELEVTRSTLDPIGRLQLLERSLLPSYRFNSDDIVVVIGQDGLVANTLKYLKGNPVIALNPDTQRWDGVLLPFVPKDLSFVLHDVLASRRSTKSITLAEAETNDGQTMLAVNDLFIGPKSHTSARYTLSYRDQSEVQSSSGLIVSTGLGSTGWFQSILAMAKGISGVSASPYERCGFAWDAPMLQFSVREPFPSKQTETTLVTGAIGAEDRFTIESHMPENGVIFSDGVESDFMGFNSGTKVNIRISDIKGKLVI